MKEQVKPKIVARWQGGGDQARLVADEAAGTEARLLAAARDCLRRLGLPGATSRAITAAAGVNLGAITYHFGSKDELVAQAMLASMREWVGPALEVLKSDLDPAARMIEAVRQLQGAFERAQDMLPVYLEALVAAPRHDTLRRGAEQILGEVRRFLEAQVGELKTLGYLPAWVEPGPMAALLVATADGIALHASIEPGVVDPSAVAAQAMQLLLAARNA